MKLTVADLDPPRSRPLLGAEIPLAELHKLDMGCEVLGIYAQVMREWAAESANPAAHGKLSWDHYPSLGDALRVLDRSLGRQHDTCCGPDCVIVTHEHV